MSPANTLPPLNTPVAGTTSYEELSQAHRFTSRQEARLPAMRFATECLAISSYQLATELVPVAGGHVPGFAGIVRFAAVHRDAFCLGVINLLAACAPWSGVGMKTAMGMGQVRLELPREHSPVPPAESDGSGASTG
jgi:hypothetical protein